MGKQNLDMLLDMLPNQDNAFKRALRFTESMHRLQVELLLRASKCRKTPRKWHHTRCRVEAIAEDLFRNNTRRGNNSSFESSRDDGKGQAASTKCYKLELHVNFYAYYCKNEIRET